MIIRDLSEADFDQWRELFLAYGVFYETEFTTEVIDGVWRDLLDPEHPETCFVANDRGNLVGFAHIQRQYDTFRAGSSWFLDDLYVHVDYRGQSIGRQLIDHAKSYALRHGGGDMRWITADTNTTAMSLYDSLAKKTHWVMYEMPTGRDLS
jgi:ribosomal protein S18 acetylase RimI-like enzyme